MRALVLTRNKRIHSRIRQSLRLRWPECEVALEPVESPILFGSNDIRAEVIFVSIDGNEDRLRLLRQLRTTTQSLLFHVGPEIEADMIDALEAGADDYVSPSATESLIVAKVNAGLRRLKRAAGPDEASVTCRDLDINPQTHEASINSRPLSLTPTEFRLLYELAISEGRVVTRQALETMIWGESGKYYVDILRKHVQRLRRKLLSVSGGHTTITTIPRIGYRLGSRS